LPDVQSACDAHDVLQVVAPHMYAPQDTSLTVWQVPEPLQVLAGVRVDPVQVSAPHTVPVAHRRQAPAPSHMPSRPQVDCDWDAQSPSGSEPPVIGRQRPSV
jgi:hypothetical protein